MGTSLLEGQSLGGTFVGSQVLPERSQKIYDAVHGFIRFNEWERMVIDSEPFQRLHDIHQLGIAYLVYPGATHTRFEHSLGTMEIATQIFDRIASKLDVSVFSGQWGERGEPRLIRPTKAIAEGSIAEEEDQHGEAAAVPMARKNRNSEFKGFPLPDVSYWLQIVRFAALCHDLGHLPFSHDAESTLLGKAGHEEWTYRAITSAMLQEVWSRMQVHFPDREIVSDVLKMAIGEKKLCEMGVVLSFSAVEKVLSQVVTGDFFGADRIDYLLRDAQCTGVSYGLFDYHQLIEMLRILGVDGELQLGVEENGIESCDALLLARHFMHQRVYQYSSVKAYKFHLARFMKSFFQGSDFLGSLEGYLALSDSDIRTAFRRAAKDPGAIGHSDAASLLKREQRFRAVALKEGMGEGELRALQEQLGIPQESLVFTDSKSHHSATLPAFPVLTRGGSVVPAHTCSRISVPAVKLRWAYVAPAYEKAFRSAVDRWA